MRSPHDITHPNQHKKRALLISIFLSVIAFVLQIYGSWITGSIALLGDTTHLFTDLFSLTMSYVAIVVSMRPVTHVRSYGMFRLEVLASFLNGILLLFVSLGLLWEGGERFFHPVNIPALPLIFIAVVGLFFNLVSAYLLLRAMKNQPHAESHFHHHHSHSCSHHKLAPNEIHHHNSAQHSHVNDRNLRGAYLHILSDAFGSVVVIVGAIIIYFTNWWWIDPILGVFLSLLILRWAAHLIIDSGHVLLEGSPQHLNPQNILQEMQSADSSIREVVDLHLWEITSNMYAASADIFVAEMSLQEADQVREKIEKILKNKYQIAHIVLAMRNR